MGYMRFFLNIIIIFALYWNILERKIKHSVPHFTGRNYSLTTIIGDSGGNIFPVEFSVVGLCTLFCKLFVLMAWVGLAAKRVCPDEDY